MRAFGFSLLLLTAGTFAYGRETVIHYHDNFLFGPPLAPGSELRLTFESQGRAPLSFSVPVPGPIAIYPQKVFYEPDAPTLGLDWNELESLMAGPEFKETIWGPPGSRSTQVFPYRVIAPPQTYAKVELHQISVGYGAYPNASAMAIWFEGEVFAVPEPPSLVLALTSSLLFMGVCRRSPIDASCFSLLLRQ